MQVLADTLAATDPEMAAHASAAASAEGEPRRAIHNHSSLRAVSKSTKQGASSKEDEGYGSAAAPAPSPTMEQLFSAGGATGKDRSHPAGGHHCRILGNSISSISMQMSC